MKRVFFLVILLIGIGASFIACSNNNQKAGQLASDEIYTCPMHNDVMSDHPGKCPKCGMHLEKQKMTTEQKKMKEEGTFVKPKE